MISSIQQQDGWPRLTGVGWLQSRHPPFHHRQPPRSSPRTGQLRLIAKGGQSMTAGDSWGIEGDLSPKAGCLASGSALQNGPMFHEDWRLSLVKSDQLRSISARPRAIFSRSLQYCWWARCYVLPSELLFIVRIWFPSINKSHSI